MKLHIYEHCPYCVKARMIFGLKDVPVELHYILNDDVETPTRMIGQKMVPILEFDDGTFMPESMDIVRLIDEREGGGKALIGPARHAVAQWLAESRNYVSRLAMPRWVKADFGEFKTRAAREYFQQKKEAGLGSFEELLDGSALLIEQANRHVKALDGIILSPGGVNGPLSEDDIHLFPALRSLSIVKGMEYPVNVEAYRKRMAEKSGVALLDAVAV